METPRTSLSIPSRERKVFAFIMGCRDFYSSALSTFSTSFTDYVVCRAISLTYSHSSLTAAPRHFFTFWYCFLLMEVLPMLLMGSALANSRAVLELAQAGSLWYGDSFWCLLPEVTLAASLLPNPCHLHCQILKLHCTSFVCIALIFLLFYKHMLIKVKTSWIPNAFVLNLLDFSNIPDFRD